MEHRCKNRSKVASITDRSSGQRFSSTERAHQGRNGKVSRRVELGSEDEEWEKQVLKQKTSLKSVSDPSSCSSGSTEEDTFTFELGWRSSKQTVGTPMKKLLAEEMLRETESKRRSSSVIAKLMGLDGLPPQQPAQKQQKKSPESCKRETTVRAQKSTTFYDHRSSRRSSKEQQDFKDVFEVPEASKMETSSCTSQGAADSKLTDAEMAFIRQKFMDAKRLSSDQKLQDSKEFQDALEVLDSNKDCLLKFLQQPDSLFSKHLHDLRGAPPQPHCGRIAVVELSDAQKSESSELRKPVRQTPRKNYSRSPQKHCDGLFSHCDSRHAACNTLSSTKNRFEGKDKLVTLPTSIVVLKPNLGKAQNGTNSASSACSSHPFLSDCMEQTEFLSVKNRKGDFRGTKNSPDNGGLSRPKSRESKEIAREITKQMRNNLSSGSMNFSSAGFRGYAGDESSCDMSGNESEVITIDSRNTHIWSNVYKPSSSHSAESSVCREAKKRLSERWKMTHKSQELRVVNRGSTLAEMLAIPDKELVSGNLDGTIGGDGIGRQFAGDNGRPVVVEPLGISSRDGWKDGSVRKLSRSRSLPASSTAFGSPTTSICSEALYDDRYFIPKETLKKERSKRAKGNYSFREVAVNRNSRSSSKKSLSSSCTVREIKEHSTEIHASRSEVKSSPESIHPSETNLMIFDSLATNVNDTSPFPENGGDVGDDHMALPSEPPDELLADVSACVAGKEDILVAGRDILLPQEPPIGPSEEGSVHLRHPLPGLESPVSSKEADQPSPVSVLELPFTDDLSSCSECFEGLNADLQGLRVQLQLLKLESEAYAEGSMLLSSDEDVGEESIFNEKGDFRKEESWEPSYVVDVLNDSGLNNVDADAFMDTWHSPECPVHPSIFEALEKKYSSETSCPRYERRLLFDRINSGLVEIYQKFMDPHPWLRSATRIGRNWIKGGLRDHLYVLLAGQEQKSKEDTLGEMLTGESHWLALGDDIDVISREIERLLTDEIVAEVVTMK